MSTTTNTSLTQQTPSESQLIFAVISGIALLSTVFFFEGTMLATAITLTGIIASAIISYTAYALKYTFRAITRLLLAGTLLSITAASIFFITTSLQIALVFPAIFITLGILQLKLFL